MISKSEGPTYTITETSKLGNWQPWHECAENKKKREWVAVDLNNRYCPVCSTKFQFNHDEKVRDWEEVTGDDE